MDDDLPRSPQISPYLPKVVAMCEDDVGCRRARLLRHLGQAPPGYERRVGVVRPLSATLGYSRPLSASLGYSLGVSV